MTFRHFQACLCSAKGQYRELRDYVFTLQNTIPQFSEEWRHVVYACYQPCALATEKDLAAKRKAWDDYAVTTHWPAANVSITSGLDYVGGALPNQSAEQ